MIVWGEKPDGSDDVVVYAGTGQWDGHHLTWVGDSVAGSIRLQDDWLARLRAVVPDQKEMLLGADYSFSVLIGPVPGGQNPGSYISTGLHWPRDDGG